MSEHAIQTKCLLKAVDPARVAAVGPWRVPVALTAAAGADDRSLTMVQRVLQKHAPDDALFQMFTVDDLLDELDDDEEVTP